LKAVSASQGLLTLAHSDVLASLDGQGNIVISPTLDGAVATLAVASAPIDSINPIVQPGVMVGDNLQTLAWALGDVSIFREWG